MGALRGGMTLRSYGGRSCKPKKKKKSLPKVGTREITLAPRNQRSSSLWLGWLRNSPPPSKPWWGQALTRLISSRPLVEDWCPISILHISWSWRWKKNKKKKEKERCPFVVTAAVEHSGQAMETVPLVWAVAPPPPSLSPHRRHTTVLMPLCLGLGPPVPEPACWLWWWAACWGCGGAWWGCWL